MARPLERSAGWPPAGCAPLPLILGACILAAPAAVAVEPVESGPVAGARVASAGGAAGRPSLRWPLERAPAIVSSFGEYRYDHLHAGIDISTGGATGLEVRAAQDGRIVRLKVEWRGYGRALYLRHADGRTTVYAHLQRYEDAKLGLERMVARRQADAGTRYPGDIYLDPAVSVRQGQVIAYSGESGAGPPHLHFEVRGPGDQPLDPFRAGLRRVEDRQPPIVESVTITAADPATYIDGVLREKSYPFERRGARHQAREPVRVTGPFQATLSAYDPIPGGRVGIRFLEILVDGRSFYRLDFETFRFDQYPLSGLVHDHRLSHLGPTRFGYRMWRLPGNALAAGPAPGAPKGGAPASSFELEEGAHRLDLLVRDAAGTESRASLCVLVGRPAPLAGARPATPGEGLPPGAVARFDPLSGVAAEKSPVGAGGRANGGDGVCPRPADSVEGEIWSEAERRFLPLDCRPAEGLCFFRTPPAAGAALPSLRLRRVAGGVPGPWQPVPEATSVASDPRLLQVELFPSFIDLLLPGDPVRDPSSPGVSECPAPGEASWRPRAGRAIGAGVAYDQAATLPPGIDPGGPECFLRHGLRGLILRYVGPSDSALIEGAGYRIDLPVGARFYPGPIAARSVPPEGLPSGLRPMGSAVDVLPEGEALNARATLSFDLGEAAGDARALGIFRFDPVTTRWSFEGDTVDGEARSIALPFRRHGLFALLRDESAPVVVAVRPRPGAGQVGRRPEIEARIEEVGKGLGPDGVSFVLDGTALESEFDPDRESARPLVQPVLAPGRHRLIVVATDRAGNVSASVESRFEVH